MSGETRGRGLTSARRAIVTRAARRDGARERALVDDGSNLTAPLIERIRIIVPVLLLVAPVLLLLLAPVLLRRCRLPLRHRRGLEARREAPSSPCLGSLSACSTAEALLCRLLLRGRRGSCLQRAFRRDAAHPQHDALPQNACMCSPQPMQRWAPAACAAPHAPSHAALATPPLAPAAAWGLPGRLSGALKPAQCGP